MANAVTTADDKRQHLQFIQDVINRMASNSFLFKGWSITIIAGISAFAANTSSSLLMVVPIVSALLFWGVDAYYLMLERAFRNIYKHVAVTAPDQIDYALNPDGIGFVVWLKTIFRPILLLFYVVVLIMLVAMALTLNHYAVKVQVTRGS